jgi:hypothetical protein
MNNSSVQDIRDRLQIIGGHNQLQEEAVPIEFTDSSELVAVVREQFGNPGRGTSVVGSLYQRTGEGQQSEKTKCICSELQIV